MDKNMKEIVKSLVEALRKKGQDSIKEDEADGLSGKRGKRPGGK